MFSIGVAKIVHHRLCDASINRSAINYSLIEKSKKLACYSSSNIELLSCLIKAYKPPQVAFY